MVARLTADSSLNHGKQRTNSYLGSLRIPHPVHPQAETHVSRVKCPLLSDLNQKWNVAINFCETTQYQIS